MSDRWATFDCYGTLIDWERGIVETMSRLWPDADSSRLLARYHEVEPQIQEASAKPYRDVLTEALERVADAERATLPADEADALVRSLPDWSPFPEVPDALRELRARGWRIAILSNVDPELLEESMERIGVDTEERITVAEAGSYKPAPGHWERFFAVTGADRARHVHVAASLFHDIEPASALGLHVIWINRHGETSDIPRAGEFPDLSGLPDGLDALTSA